MIPNILQGLTDAHLVEDLEEILANWPLAIVASTQTHLINDEVIRSRQYPWGTVDVDNAQHSDLHLAERLLVA
jgi:septin 6/8/11